MAHPLDPAWAKIRRAETHIKDLNREVAAFIGARHYRLVPKLNDEGTEEVWSIDVGPLDDTIEAIAADAVHNLRTPLDKMLAAGFRAGALHKARADIGKLKFPASNHLNEFKTVLTRLEEHLTGPVIQFLREIQPFKGGAGEALWAVNALDNRDKHRALLEPIKISFSTAEHRQVRVLDGFLLRLGSARGKHMVPVPDAKLGDWHMHQPDQELAPILRLTPGTVRDHYLEFTSAQSDMEVLTVTPGSKVQADIKPALNIGFSDIEVFEGVPVVNALETMRKAVLETVEEFRRRFGMAIV